MAIADLFHCENISNLVVETPRFKRMVNVLSKIGSDFKIPKRKQIGGPLLDLNFQTKYNDNKTNLLKGADVFGLSFLGDGAHLKYLTFLSPAQSLMRPPSRRRGKNIGALTSNNPIVTGMCDRGVVVST